MLNGGDGTDRINIRLTEAGAPAVGQTVVPTMSSVERVFVQSLAATAAGAFVDLVNATGVQELWNNNSTGDLTVRNVQEKATVGVIDGVGADYTIVYDDAVIEGEQNIVLDDAEVGVLRVDDGATDGFATINIDATAGNSEVVELRSGSAAGNTTGDLVNLNLTGEGSVVIFGALDNGVVAIDASGNSGGVDVTLAAASTRNVTFTGGTGDDRVDFNDTLNLLDSGDRILNSPD